jgi:hypothetical protein
VRHIDLPFAPDLVEAPISPIFIENRFEINLSTLAAYAIGHVPMF